MEGYTVFTVDDKKVGRISAVTSDFFVVEHGTLLRSRLPLPKSFASVDDDMHCVWAGVSKQVLCAAPKVARDGTIDERAVSSFYVRVID